MARYLAVVTQHGAHITISPVHRGTWGGVSPPGIDNTLPPVEGPVDPDYGVPEGGFPTHGAGQHSFLRI